MTPEGRIKALVKRRMTAAFPDAYCFRPVQNGMGAPGLDEFWCIHGLWVAIEDKAPGLKMTERQKTTAADIIKAGGLVFMVDGEERLNAAIAFIRQAVAQRNCEAQGWSCAGNRTIGPDK